MKAFKFSLVIAAVAIAIIGFSGSAGAFHSGGVAECGGCHSMHSAPAGSSFLLVGTDQSSACLTCHERAGMSGYRVSTPLASMGTGTAPMQRTPGGDFGWIKKNYTGAEAGERHGHNIVAADFGYVADVQNATAPGGGTMNSAQLGCHSCHDPHGKYRRLNNGTIATTGAPIIGSGSYNTSLEPAAGEAVGVYRLLAGASYTKGGANFSVNPPIAIAPSTYNRSEATTQTRVAYGSGMSQWCSSCHPQMHDGSSLRHPVSENLGSTIAQNYNRYVRTGDMTGTQANSYLSLVPYEENSTDYGALKAIAATSGTAAIAGPTSGAQVQCLTCHRAHASGFPEMTRWSDTEFLTYQGLWPGTDNTSSRYARGKTAAETQAAYYDRPVSVLGSYQRSLCNKCHAQD